VRVALGLSKADAASGSFPPWPLSLPCCGFSIMGTSSAKDELEPVEERGDCDCTAIFLFFPLCSSLLLLPLSRRVVSFQSDSIELVGATGLRRGRTQRGLPWRSRRVRILVVAVGETGGDIRCAESYSSCCGTKEREDVLLEGVKGGRK
jgi:hypothetical protein